MSEAVGEIDEVSRGQVAIEPVAHLDGRAEGRVAQVEQVGEVLAGVLVPRGEERDRPGVGARHDPRREEPRAVREVETTFGDELDAALAHQLELMVDAHAGAFVGVAITDEEDSAAVTAALHDGVATTGAPPLAVLLDNKPSNHTEEVDAALDPDTLRIRATPFRP